MEAPNYEGDGLSLVSGSMSGEDWSDSIFQALLEQGRRQHEEFQRVQVLTGLSSTFSAMSSASQAESEYAPSCTTDETCCSYFSPTGSCMHYQGSLAVGMVAHHDAASGTR